MIKLRAIVTVEVEVDRADPDAEAIEEKIAAILRAHPVRLSDRFEDATAILIDRELKEDPDFQVTCDVTWEAE